MAMDEQPVAPGSATPEPPVEALLPVKLAETHDRYPFWSYADVVVFFALAFPCILLGYFVIQAFLWMFHLHAHSTAVVLVPAQFLGYGFAFLPLYLLLKLHYHRPFWESLRWVHTRPGASTCILYGFILAFAVALFGRALQTPDLNTPMKQ